MFINSSKNKNQKRNLSKWKFIIPITLFALTSIALYSTDTIQLESVFSSHLNSIKKFDLTNGPNKENAGLVKILQGYVGADLFEAGSKTKIKQKYVDLANKISSHKDRLDSLKLIVTCEAHPSQLSKEIKDKAEKLTFEAPWERFVTGETGSKTYYITDHFNSQRVYFEFNYQNSPWKEYKSEKAIHYCRTWETDFKAAYENHITIMDGKIPVFKVPHSKRRFSVYSLTDPDAAYIVTDIERGEKYGINQPDEFFITVNKLSGATFEELKKVK